MTVRRAWRHMPPLSRFVVGVAVGVCGFELLLQFIERVVDP